MRQFIAVLACLSLPFAAAAQEADFNGAWIAWLCPSGVKSDFAKCGNFTLELIQKENRLCGTHLFATAGAGQMDEGDAASLGGEITLDAAAVTIVSSRAVTPLRVTGELTLTDNRLLWRRTGNPGGNHLLPANAQFTKSKSRTLRTAAFERELQNACAPLLAPPAKEAAPAPEPALRPIPADRIDQSRGG